VKKHRTAIIIISAVVVVGATLLHFVPFDSRTEYQCDLTQDLNQDSSPRYYTYRWITGGVNKWDELLTQTGPKTTFCNIPVHIKLYML
jgi:hypothetical protein